MNSNSKIIIIVSFALIILIQIALTLLATYSISSGLKTIYEVNTDNNTAQYIFDMRDAAHNRALLLYRMLRESDEFEREEMREVFYQHAEVFIKSREKIDAELLSRLLKEEFSEAIEAASVGQQVQTKAIEQIFEGDLHNADKLLKNEIIPAQDAFILKFTHLLGHVKEEVKNNIAFLSEQSDENITLITLLGVTGAFLIIIIATYMYQKIINSERNFIRQKEIAERSSEAKTMFLANMSHEIRSPLTAIIGFSESILNRNLSIEQQREANKSIERNGKHLYQVINDILDITKIESGQLDVEAVPSSPIKIAQEVSRIYEPLVQEKNLNFKVNYHFPLPKLIDTDPIRLKQILINLISNALKFTSEGGISIDLRYSEESREFEYEVKDSGIGMDEETVLNIFGAFIQADTSTTRRYGGTGLGLNISKQLSEKLGGELICKSKIGEGSRFYFKIYVPPGREIELVDAIEHSDDLVKTETKQISLQGEILVAEDTIDNQKLIEMYISDSGAAVTIVDNGLLAVEACSSKKFDLIFMDMQMPVMDGVTATQKIRLFDKSTPIVSLTANAMKSDVEKCRLAGANDFMSKPIDPNQFSDILLEYLRTGNSNKIKSTQKNSSLKKSKEEKKKSFEKIVHRFVAALPDRAKLITQLQKDKKWEELKSETHKLKGLGTSMGFPELTDICNEINNNCTVKKYDANIPLIKKLNTEIGLICKD